MSHPSHCCLAGLVPGHSTYRHRLSARPCAARRTREAGARHGAVAYREALCCLACAGSRNALRRAGTPSWGCVTSAPWQTARLFAVKAPRCLGQFGRRRTQIPAFRAVKRFSARPRTHVVRSPSFFASTPKCCSAILHYTSSPCERLFRSIYTRTLLDDGDVCIADHDACVSLA